MFVTIRSVYTASDHLADIGIDCIHSYHSHKALQMMNKYRIGRIAAPWVNFTPPIRGGIYRDSTEAAQHTSDDEDGDDAGSSWSSSLDSLNSSTTSLGSITVGDIGHSAIMSSCPNQGLDRYSSPAYRSKISPSNAQLNNPQRLSPKDYTSSAVQKAIDNDIRDNPSLDAETQRVITLKYQMLHQRVKDEGYYDCHYIEYGKEIIRYTLLFSLFFTFLREEWYLTSACLLGLFWVSPYITSSSSQRADPPTASDHVHGP